MNTMPMPVAMIKNHSLVITSQTGEHHYFSTVTTKSGEAVTETYQIPLLVSNGQIVVEHVKDKFAWKSGHPIPDGTEYTLQIVAVHEDGITSEVCEIGMVFGKGEKPAEKPAPAPLPIPPIPTPAPAPKPATASMTKVVELKARLHCLETDLEKMEKGHADKNIRPPGNRLRQMSAGLTDMENQIRGLSILFPTDPTVRGLEEVLLRLESRVDHMFEVRGSNSPIPAPAPAPAPKPAPTPQDDAQKQLMKELLEAKVVMEKATAEAKKEVARLKEELEKAKKAPPALALEVPTWRKFVPILLGILAVILAVWFYNRVAGKDNAPTTSNGVAKQQAKPPVIIDPPKSGTLIQRGSTIAPVINTNGNVGGVAVTVLPVKAKTTITGNSGQVVINYGTIMGGISHGSSATSTKADGPPKVWPEGFEPPAMVPMVDPRCLEDPRIMRQEVKFTIAPKGAINVSSTPPFGWMVSFQCDGRIRCAYDVRQNAGDPCKWISKDDYRGGVVSRCWIENLEDRPVVVIFTLTRGTTPRQ